MKSAEDYIFMARVICIVLICLCVAGVGLCEEGAIAVQAGDICYKADRIQFEIETLIQAYEQKFGEATDETREGIALETVNRYAMLAVVKLRLRDLKLDGPDENTQYALRSEAQARYEQYWQGLRASDALKNVSDEEITQALSGNGVTLDVVYEETLDNWQIQTLLDYYKVDISVSDEDLQNYYLESYVAPCKERYADNVPLFEEEVLYGDATSAYVPDGYRLLYQIRIPIPQEIQKELDDVEAEAKEHQKTADDVYNEIAQKAVAGEDVTELRETFLAEKNTVDQLEVRYGEIWRTIPEAVQDTTDEIYARIELGESFDSLMGDDSADAFMLYHPDSVVWPDDLRNAADGLKDPGDISLPVLSSEGVHILYYEQDAPCGTIELDEKNQEILRYELEQTTLLTKLDELLEPWKEEYGLAIDLSAIHY